MRDDEGKPYKTEKQASRARTVAIEKAKNQVTIPKNVIIRKTFNKVYEEYCEKGRFGKVYATIKKQDSLWNKGD